LSFGLTVGDYQVKSLGSAFKLGLDLKGGVSIEEEAQGKNVDKDTLERAKELLELRVNSLGVAESNVQITGQNRILIEIPGIYDAQAALETVGKTGKLRFVGPNNDEVLTGSDVEDATVGVDPSSNQPVVQLKLKSEGTTKFAEATQKYIGQKITIYMDKDVVSAPTVRSAIPDGSAVITGSKDIAEAKRLAGIIKSGALPVELAPAQVRTIGPSLGAEAIPTSLKASVIGIALVMLFMLLYYRLPGFIADLALTVYIMLTLLIFTLVLKQTLTLPGIAGFLLSIGMAVDANVLIFERIKEELRVGKSLKNAIDAGFHRALSSIVDSNITTLIAGFALYLLGQGSVKGFALTLNIGILCSMFTAITVTKFLLKNMVGTGWLSDKKYYGA
jgi:preprotein translocase subunit SecD